MLCQHCKKNQATKTYEQTKKGKREVAYFCLECYHKIFLCADGEDEGTPRTVCPYCGTTATEFKKRNLVGCANCYTTLASYVYPVIMKMQGEEVHKGEKPFKKDESEQSEKRLYELKTLSKKYKDEQDYESARAYEERLVRLENGLEEDYVWRNRLLLSKRS